VLTIFVPTLQGSLRSFDIREGWRAFCASAHFRRQRCRRTGSMFDRNFGAALTMATRKPDDFLCPCAEDFDFGQTPV
jgi:hypothetical protein